MRFKIRFTPQHREFFVLYGRASANVVETARLLVEFLDRFRDDMYRLAGALDDICDHVDEAADNIGLYGVKVIPDQAKQQAQVILRASIQLEEAVSRLDGFKDVRSQLNELRSLEDEGDRLARDAIAGLFRSGQDPVSIIRWKDLHEQLEAAVDSCEYAADVLEAIVVKNR